MLENALKPVPQSTSESTAANDPLRVNGYKPVLEAIRPDGKRVEVAEKDREKRVAALVFSRHFENDPGDKDKILAFAKMAKATAAVVDNIDLDTLYFHNHLIFADGNSEAEKKSKAEMLCLANNGRWKATYLKLINGNLAETKGTDVVYSQFFQGKDISKQPYIGLILSEVLEELTKKDTDFNEKIFTAIDSGARYIRTHATKLKSKGELLRPLDPNEVNQNSQIFIYRESAFVLCLRLCCKYNALYYFGPKLNDPTAFLSNCHFAENSEFFNILKIKIYELLKQSPAVATAEQDAEREARIILAKINNHPMEPVAIKSWDFKNGYHTRNQSHAALNDRAGPGLFNNVNGHPQMAQGVPLSLQHKTAAAQSGVPGGGQQVAAVSSPARKISPPGSPKSKTPPMGASPPETIRAAMEGVAAQVMCQKDMSRDEKLSFLADLVVTVNERLTEKPIERKRSSSFSEGTNKVRVSDAIERDADSENDLRRGGSANQQIRRRWKGPVKQFPIDVVAVCDEKPPSNGISVLPAASSASRANGETTGSSQAEVRKSARPGVGVGVTGLS